MLLTLARAWQFAERLRTAQIVRTQVGHVDYVLDAEMTQRPLVFHAIQVSAVHPIGYFHQLVVCYQTISLLFFYFCCCRCCAFFFVFILEIRNAKRNLKIRKNKTKVSRQASK